ncbi:MAG: hypothetical protein M5U34_03690 [Chloroflexi bacterium]|nr:hypothetical protein [Chloroflexota bacterium]
MPYAPFYSKFPKTAVAETRAITVFDHPDLPPGDYGFLELFCDEPGCDCRRVMFNIQIPESPNPLAVVAFGWESRDFYVKWFGEDDPEIIRELQGPGLNITSAQFSLAPALLEATIGLLADEAYVERIKRHYAMFRQEVEKDTRKKRRNRPRKPKRKR